MVESTKIFDQTLHLKNVLWIHQIVFTETLNFKIFGQIRCYNKSFLLASNPWNLKNLSGELFSVLPFFQISFQKMAFYHHHHVILALNFAWDKALEYSRDLLS